MARKPEHWHAATLDETADRAEYAFRFLTAQPFHDLPTTGESLWVGDLMHDTFCCNYHGCDRYVLLRIRAGAPSDLRELARIDADDRALPYSIQLETTAESADDFLPYYLATGAQIRWDPVTRRVSELEGRGRRPGGIISPHPSALLERLSLPARTAKHPYRPLYRPDGLSLIFINPEREDDRLIDSRNVDDPSRWYLRQSGDTLLMVKPCQSLQGENGEPPRPQFKYARLWKLPPRLDPRTAWAIGADAGTASVPSGAP